MKKIFTRNINKIAMIAVLIVAVSALASCRQGSWPTTPYTTWGAEWKFSSWWQGLWGWPVALLSYPIAFLMGSIGKLCGDSYAWGIIFTTIIVRTIAWPIYAKQNSTTMKMQLIQPEMEKIQRKYMNRKDPEGQQRMQQEMMALYRKYKMNPLGCGLTLFMQFPIFMAMYECVRRVQLKTVVDGTLEIAGRFTLASTKIFGIFDINTSVMGNSSSGIAKASRPADVIFGIVIALAFSAITLLSQKLSQRPMKNQPQRRTAKTQQQEQQQKQMKIMNYVMVAMFFFMSLSSTALSLYWLVGAIYQLGQQQVGRKLNERAFKKAQEKSNII